jgi:hypothetical protein
VENLRFKEPLVLRRMGGGGVGKNCSKMFHFLFAFWAALIWTSLQTD